MRHRRGLRKLWHGTCVVLYWFCWLGGCLIAGLNKVDAAKIPVFVTPYFSPVVNWAQGNTWWFVTICLVFAPLLNSKRSVKQQSKVDSAIKKLLDEFRKRAFPENGNFTDYRVTLFQHRKWFWGWWFGLEVLLKAIVSRGRRRRWPCSGWLVPYERAGSYHLNSRTYFYAPRDNIDLAEGFAGLVFKNLGTHAREELPDPSKNYKKCKSYAEHTNTSVEYVQRLLARENVDMPLAFWGCQIDVDGQPWGVILVDCRVPTLPPDLMTTFAPFGMSISILLSRKS